LRRNKNPHQSPSTRAYTALPPKSVLRLPKHLLNLQQPPPRIRERNLGGRQDKSQLCIPAVGSIQALEPDPGDDLVAIDLGRALPELLHGAEAVDGELGTVGVAADGEALVGDGGGCQRRHVRPGEVADVDLGGGKKGC
jgi:hypothetical protein